MLLEGDDYRLEAMLAFWIENEFGNLDQLTVHPQGTFSRSFSPDVLEIKQFEDKFRIEISREGLYDMLPEGLFHEGKRKVKKDTEESVEESLRYRKEEREARKFFLPLEQEFYRQRVWLEHLELKSYLTSINAENVAKFLRFWGVDPDLFSLEQGHFLLALFPNIHRIAGNLELSAYCLEVLMGEKIHIEMTPSPETILEDEGSMISLLGDAYLGVDAVLGNCFIDDEPGLTVHIGPVPVEHVFPFLNGELADRQLKVLYGFFFPVETVVMTNISVESAAEGFLMDPEDPNFARLDLTTVL